MKDGTIRALRRVALCDDEAILRKIAHKMISACGYEPCVLDSGSKLIAFLENGGLENLTAIIVDLQMPDMSGAELFTRLKETAPDVPVIISTGHIENDYVREAIEAGAVHFLNKPYSMAELCRSIDIAAGAALV